MSELRATSRSRGTNKPLKQVFRPSEVGEMCGVSSSLVRMWIRKRGLKGRKIPMSTHYLIDRPVLVQFMLDNDIPVRLMELYDARENLESV